MRIFFLIILLLLTTVFFSHDACMNAVLGNTCASAGLPIDPEVIKPTKLVERSPVVPAESINLDCERCNIGVVHGSEVTVSINGNYKRRITEYNFEGGVNGIIENKETDTKFEKMGRWHFGQETRYTNNASHSYAKVDSIRGKVIYSKAKPPEETSRANAALKTEIKGIPVNTKFRWSYWTKANELNRDTSNWWQWKMTRLNNQQNFYPDFAMFNRIRSSDLIDYSPGDKDVETSYWVAGTLPDTNNRWFKLTYEIYTGTKGKRDGKFRIYITDKNGTRLMPSRSDKFGKYPDNMMVYNGKYRINRILVQNYIGNSKQTVEFFTDDMNFQTGSWATVVITDNEDYAKSTVMEDQEIISWLNISTKTDIQYVLNKGGLKAGAYYEHIKDDNGQVISTREIQIVDR